VTQFLTSLLHRLRAAAGRFAASVEVAARRRMDIFDAAVCAYHMLGHALFMT
jgi:hypothetical protein